jgi:hypothetical protein
MAVVFERSNSADRERETQRRRREEDDENDEGGVVGR